MTTINLLRHAELEGGVKYRGTTDDALTQNGRIRMQKIWEQVRENTELIISSPLQRCSQPAKEWAREKVIPCLIEPRFREMEYGAWEGLSHADIEQQFPAMLSSWRNNPVETQIPDAESLHTFSNRVRQGWHDLLVRQREHNVLLISHSGPIRIILTDVINAPLASIRRFDIQYASWSGINITGENPVLEFLNR